MEHRFESDGFINGIRTPIQSYICRNCSFIIEVPDGTNPYDYQMAECVKTKPVINEEIKKKWFSPNKRDYPKKGKRHETNSSFM